MRIRVVAATRPLPRAIALTWAALVLSTGCPGRRLEEVPVAPVEAAPAAADRGLCADVADSRVCWLGPGESADGGAPGANGGAICVDKRPLPPGPAPTAGWRCYGHGKERTCVDRGLGGGPFACERNRCIQRYPRMPDDGEWECIDMAGAVMCRRGVPPAGVVTGPPDVGWLCGERVTDEGKERVCVDFSPDLPEGKTRGWRCRYDHKRRERRVCRQSERAPALGSACEAGSPCPESLVCAAGRCVPRSPAKISCWFDKECNPGQKCHLSSCVGGESK